MTSPLVPPALRPGDAVRVIAPSSPFDQELFFAGVDWLSQRYRVELADHVLSRSGFLAGTDAERLADLDDALGARHVAAIVAARGGHGAVRIAHRANWGALQQHPKWLVGFSDVTLLHLEALRVGVCVLHAENVAGLGRAEASARASWLQALEQPEVPRALRGTHAIQPGVAQGRLFGGNLTMLFTALATGRLELPTGCILVLEDVTETSYRIDRMLTALAIGGAFTSIGGLALGDFTDCPPGPHGVPVEQVLSERLAGLGIPVVAGFGFGHGRSNAPLTLGGPARLDAETLRLTLG